MNPGGNPWGHSHECRCSEQCTTHARQHHAARTKRWRDQQRADGYVYRRGLRVVPDPDGLPSHGTYRRHALGCRCDKCTAALAHGKRRAYCSGCRCDECTKAAAAYMRQYRTANPGRSTKPVRPPDPIPDPTRLFVRADWMDQGECRNFPVEAFFPRRGDYNTERLARSICAECPVRITCLNYALDSGEQFGIWGGTSERQRKKLRAENAGALS